MRCYVPLTKPGLFNHRTVLAYLRARAVPGLEEVGVSSYRRAVRLDGACCVATFDFAAPHRTARLQLSADAPASTAPELRAMARRLFDLDTDISLVERTLAEDQTVARIIRFQPGLRIPGTTDPFELAVRAIIGQQISVAGAAKRAMELTYSAGGLIGAPRGRITHAFPSAHALATADLGGLGIPRQRQQAISGLARGLLDGTIVLDGSRSREVTAEALLAVRGIGPWTASYIALRALNDGDAIPLLDVGLRSVMSRGGRLISARDLSVRAERWRPWRGYAAMHLWTTLLPGPFNQQDCYPADPRDASR